MRAIENTLQQLVQQRNGSQVDLHPLAQDPSRGANAVRPTVEDEDVATLSEDEQQLQNAAEDWVDGMATIIDPEEAESRFFGQFDDPPLNVTDEMPGPSSTIVFLRHVSDATSATLRSLGHSRHSDPRFNQPLVSRAPSPMASMSEASPAARHPANLRALPSEARALHLMKLFFSDTGMLFPYIHEEEILRTYTRAKENHFAGVSRSWLCLLNVIFAFATYVSARPDLPAEKNATESEVFFERAQGLSAEIDMKSANVQTGVYPQVAKTEPSA